MSNPPWRLALPPTAPKPDDERWLAHLNALYSQEYTLLNLAVSVGAVAAPLLAAFTIKLQPTCVKHESPSTFKCVNTTELLAIPLGPVLLLLFLGFLFFNSRIVGKYTRYLERIISGDPQISDRALHFPALSRLNGALYGGEASRLRALRVFYQAIGLTVVVTSIFTVISVLNRVPNTTVRAGAFVFYSLVALLCLAAYGTGARHRNFEILLTAVATRDRHESQAPPPEIEHMGWVGYGFRMLLPRPLSVVSKGQDGLIVLVLVPFLAGHWPGVGHVWRTFLALVVFELVLYQTRYLLNGIREVQAAGFNLPADRRNQSALPFSPGQQIGAFCFALVRIALFCVIILGNPIVSVRFMWLTVAAFLASYYLYEVPRELARIAFIKASEPEEVPGPAPGSDYTGALPSSDPTDTPTMTQSRKLLAALRTHRVLPWLMFAFVGGGYALRVSFVLFLFSEHFARSATGVLVVAAVWAAASAGVAAGWAVEFTGAMSVRSDRSVRLHPSLVMKPQLVWAAGYAKGAGEVTDLYPLETPEIASFDKDDSLMKKQRLKIWHFPGIRKAPWRLAAQLGLGLWLAVTLPYGPLWKDVLAAALYVGLAVYLRMPWHRRITKDEAEEAARLASEGFAAWGSAEGNPQVAGTVLASSTPIKWPVWLLAGAIAAVAAIGSPLSLGAAVIAGAVWTMVRLGSSEDGSLWGLVISAERLQDWFDQKGQKAMRDALGVVATLAVGSGVVDAFGHRSGDWWSRAYPDDKGGSDG